MFEINQNSQNQINELIGLGWEFMLHYGKHDTYCKIKTNSWEADFTKRKDDGLWDNHESGYSLMVDEAINIAYNNIKNEVRLNKKSK